jgi:hypothetical protein
MREPAARWFNAPNRAATVVRMDRVVTAGGRDGASHARQVARTLGDRMSQRAHMLAHALGTSVWRPRGVTTDPSIARLDRARRRFSRRVALKVIIVTMLLADAVLVRLAFAHASALERPADRPASAVTTGTTCVPHTGQHCNLGA